MLQAEPAWEKRKPTFGKQLHDIYASSNAEMDQIYASTPFPLYRINDGGTWREESGHWWENQDLSYTSAYQ